MCGRTHASATGLGRITARSIRTRAELAEHVSTPLIGIEENDAVYTRPDEMTILLKDYV
jgi:hypothetical protein